MLTKIELEDYIIKNNIFFRYQFSTQLYHSLARAYIEHRTKVRNERIRQKKILKFINTPKYKPYPNEK